MKTEDLEIKRFDWGDWAALWELRAHQLAEEGIEITLIPSAPDLSSPYEQDYHRIDEVYLRGAGGFWIAWDSERPVGHVGAQDLRGVVELRAMYVRADYRRKGVGTRLVTALVDHCIDHAVTAIELWTAANGPGRFLYSKVGFQAVGEPGAEFGNAPISADEASKGGEIRMRLELSDAPVSWRTQI